MRSFFITIALLAFSCLPTWGQQALDEILSQLPAKNTNSLEILLEEIVEIGPEVIVELSGKLEVAGGKDQPERLALSGLAKYVAGSTEESRKVVEQGFLKALNQKLNITSEVFLLEQMQFFASDASVEVVSGRVVDLCEPAVQLLAVIASANALQALSKAADNSQGYCKQVIIKALGAFEGVMITDLLKKYAQDKSDLQSREIALQGLANNAAPDVLPILKIFAREDSKSGNDLLLKHGFVLAERNSTNPIQEIVKQVMENGSDRQKGEALTLAQYLGPTARKILIKALKKGSPGVASNAVSALIKSGIPLSNYFKNIRRVDDVVKIKLLNAARVSKYPGALSSARSLLQSANPEVQMAAIKALSELQGSNGLIELQKVIASPQDEKVLEVTLNEASRWITKDRVGLFRDMLNNAPDKNKSQILRLIGQRGLGTLWQDVKPLLVHQNQGVRQSAFQTLPKLSKDLTVTDLISVVSYADNDEERELVKTAFANKSRQVEDRDDLVGPLVSTFGNSNPSLLAGVLPAIGGRRALDFVIGKSNNESILQWKSSEAIPQLFTLLDDGKAEAFTVIMRLLRQTPEAQQVLYLRKLLPYSKTVDDKKGIINGLGRTNSFTAFMVASTFLQDPDLSVSAARALINIALPPDGAADGLTGEVVKGTLMKADSILSKEGDDYTLAFLHSYLKTMPDENGFVSMFNGVDFDGWQGLVENPIARDTMFSMDLKARQIIADEKLLQNWKVERGAITFFGEGYDNLCSVKSYRDFELLVDWKISKDGDSGIYLRGTPQVQIWDTARTESGAEVGSGGLYNNQIHESKPLTVADNAIGEWNTFRIIMIQDKVTVYLNGVLVTDNIILENYWNREMPIFREGPLELQAHGTNIQFRDIYVREIASAPDLSEIERNQGFISIFNGVNLDGWVGNKSDYIVENNEIVIYPSGGGGSGNLFTEREYDNFTLRFEFKLTPGANNGLGIHAPLEGDAAYEGKEIQILDNTSPKYAALKDYQFHGSAYGLAPARKGELRPVGEWNSQEVKVNGNQITVVLNGQRILHEDLDIVTRDGTLDGREHPGLKRLKGHIGFLGHGSEVHFRNIRIKEITKH